MKKIWFLLVSLLILAGPVAAQNKIKGPVSPDQKMPQFVLPTYQGGNFDMASLKGKNVVLFFVRGLVEKDHWCNICHYGYVQLMDYENKMQLQKKYNAEFAFVLPYDKDSVAHWVSIFPAQLKVIEGWKNPANPEKLDERAKNWMELTRKLFPVKYEVEPSAIKTPFPIIIDGEKSLSKALDLFTMHWGGTDAPQNVPSVIIIDKNGTVVFKYISQNTIDRPSYDYLIKVFDAFL